MRKLIFIVMISSLLCNCFSNNITSVDASVYNKNDLTSINYFLNIVFAESAFNKNQLMNTNKISEQIDSNSGSQSQIWWSGLGGSIIGAIIGALGGGAVSAHLSKRNLSENRHLLDLTQELVKPLISEIKNNFYPSYETDKPFIHTIGISDSSPNPIDERFVPTIGISDSSPNPIDEPNLSIILNLGESNFFDYIQKGQEIEITSENILFEDLIKNHYPKVEVHLKQMLKIYIDFENSRNNLLLIIENEMKKLDSISINAEKEEAYYMGWKITLREYIKNKKYDDSFLRITHYGNNTYLYIYHTKNDILPFGQGEHQYLIFKAFGENKEENIRRVEEVRDQLIEIIRQIKNTIFFQDYEDTLIKFYNEKKKLLKYLYKINYSTSLYFEKTETMEKKCSLIP